MRNSRCVLRSYFCAARILQNRRYEDFGLFLGSEDALEVQYIRGDRFDNRNANPAFMACPPSQYYLCEKVRITIDIY